jgi:hypothetical protein
MSEKYDYSKFSKQEAEEIFGPTSNSVKAAQMAKFDPQKYSALKQSAAYIHGLIAPVMLPRASQLTREQLDAKARADAAAQKDESFTLAPALADRLGIPADTKVSWETFQRLMGRTND